MGQVEPGRVSFAGASGGIRNFQWLFEWVGLLVAALLFVVFAKRVVEDFGTGSLVPLGLALFLSYYAADLVSGFVHWACDRYGSARTPILGETFIEPFREHHRDPAAITQRGFVEVNGNTAIALAPILMVVHFTIPVSGSSVDLFFHAFAMLLAAWLIATNQFHKLAHMPREQTSRLTLWLQRKRLILPRSHHQQHHQAPFDRHYCITTGRLDGLLEKIGFWERLQAVIRRVSVSVRGYRSSQ